MRTRRAPAAIALLAVVALAGTVAVPVPTGPVPTDPESFRTGGMRTVEDARPGTVFTTVRRGGEPVYGPVGILKRGRTGGALYNPSTDLVDLRPGDVLVDREGRRYRMTIPQRHAGGSGVVGAGATVFPGETGLSFVGFSDGQFDRFPITAVGGDAFVLDGSVPGDLPPGIYLERGPATERRTVLDTSVGGQAPPAPTLTVREARVTDLRVVAGSGEPVEPGARLPAEGLLVVSARVDFLGAEPARIRLVDAANGTTLTEGVLSRSAAIARFPARAQSIGRTVPAGQARPEGPDGARRSLANPVLEPTTRLYLLYDLGTIDEPTTVEAVVSADDRGPFGDLAAVGVRQSVRVRVGNGSSIAAEGAG